MEYNAVQASVCSLNIDPKQLGKVLSPLMALCFRSESIKDSGMSLIVLGQESKSFEDVLLERIAHHVGDGSYIEMSDNNGQRWRWVFTGGSYQKVYAELFWPSVMAE